MSIEFLRSEMSAARGRFHDLASRPGWTANAISLDTCQATDVNVREPDLADTIDVVISDAEPDAPTLLVTGGLHGIEGLFGSAAQLAVMDRWGSKLSSMNIRVVMVHSLNPWGFVNGRRTDPGNRDLNRNFLLPGQEYKGAPPLYPQLDPLINPSRWPTCDFFLPKAIRLIAGQGFSQLRRAIAEGQYDFPDGLFFGGRDAARQHQLLADWLPRWIGNSQRVIHVDLHTGLGKWKTWQLLPDGNLADHHRRELSDWFGTDRFAASSHHNGGYQARGGIGRWCANQVDVDYLYVCAEFGTYSGLRLLKAMRRENHCHRAVAAGRMQPSQPAWKKAKHELREMFFPQDSSWRDFAIDESTNLIEKIAVSLQSPSP